jgi:hypothetical protein
MTIDYKVYPYSLDNLKQILADSRSIEFINQKSHTQYFDRYFSYQQAKTVILENQYIDLDYLEDFSSYYVRCFYEYPRECRRVHFFKEEFTSSDYESYLDGESSNLSPEILQNNYLGFIVLKPLPEKIIGRTCLKTYPEKEDSKNRFYPIKRPYQVNLFGTSLTIESLAFQEQDRVAAACASSALWSVFHGTGKLFHHPIPSPIEITKAANEKFPLRNRALPNNGLTFEQMAQAIRNVGLEPSYINVFDQLIFKSSLYAYLKGKLPIPFIFDLYDLSGPEVTLNTGNELHAAAITGFSLTDTPCSGFMDNFYLKAFRINKIYAHDDQVGPFARMDFDASEKEIITQGGEAIRLDKFNIKLNDDQQINCKNSLSTTWLDKTGGFNGIRAFPNSLIIPLYHKIRIPFEFILELIFVYNAFISNLLKTSLKYSNEDDQLEWDIYLTNSNDFKEELAKNHLLKGKARTEALTLYLPRFIWIARAEIKSSIAFDLLFDATDLMQGEFFLRPIFYDQDVFSLISEVSSLPELSTSDYRYNPVWRIFQWFIDNKTPTTSLLS